MVAMIRAVWKDSAHQDVPIPVLHHAGWVVEGGGQAGVCCKLLISGGLHIDRVSGRYGIGHADLALLAMRTHVAV